MKHFKGDRCRIEKNVGNTTSDAPRIQKKNGTHTKYLSVTTRLNIGFANLIWGWGGGHQIGIGNCKNCEHFQYFARKPQDRPLDTSLLPLI